jgi:hypothetical protein
MIEHCRMTIIGCIWQNEASIINVYVCKPWGAPDFENPSQMMAWRTLAETHSLTTTVAMMISRMSDT